MNGAAVTLICREQPDLLETCLVATLAPLAAKGLAFEAERSVRGGCTAFRLAPAAGRRNQEVVKALRGAAAAAVADFVLRHHLPARLSRLAERCYPELAAGERCRLVAEAVEPWTAGGAAAVGQDLRAGLEEWLARHPEVAVEGYVRFRLGGAVALLGEGLHRGAEALLREREESRLLTAVRATLEGSPRRLGRAHVHRSGRGYLLRGEEGSLSDLPAELGLSPADGGEGGDEDGILAALFWLNPGCIVLHGTPLPEPWRRTLALAFAERVTTCGCCGQEGGG